MIEAAPPSPPPSTPPFPYRRPVHTHFGLGFASAIVALLVFPEIFASIAIVLGAYTYKQEQGNRGMYLVIFGIICMLIGIYLTAISVAELIVFG